MQSEVDAESTAVAIQIHGVNGAGHETGNAETCANRTLPWLQDTSQENVWSKWSVTYRDVLILDGQNRPVAVFNLTLNNLATAAAYDSLKTLLLRTAGE
jgi:hypothetical protein